MPGAQEELMQVRSRIVGSLIVLGLLLLATAAICEDRPASAAAAQTNTVTAGDPLLQLLVSKGVLNADEAKSLSGTPAEQRAKLLNLLRQKGILSASDYETLTTPSASAQVDPNLVASTTPILPAAVPQAAAPKVEEPKPAAPAVVPAIAPLRVITQDPPKKDGLNAAFKMGPVKMTPYGFIKTTAAYDSSSPNGDDFPFVGLWLNNLTNGYTTSTGPDKDPEFHVKARSTRIGANFEWPDPSPKLTFTGRIEGDYEGNYSIVDNRDVSSLRSNAFQLRLAYLRMDVAGDKTDFYFEGGQDWTLFGSTALPSILETTFLGAFYGDVYERSPQMMLGLVQKLGGSVKLDPTFAIMMPTSSQIEKLGTLGPAAQLAQAEREGADSGRPELEGRLALQFQLDKAPGVAPAQIFWSGVRGRRTSITDATVMAAGPAAYDAVYPNGFKVSSTIWGNQLGIQLPTRWFTLVGSLYKGGDLRFFFGGQVNSYFTDTGGLTLGTVHVYPTIDGGPMAAAGGAAIGCTGTLSEDGSTCSGTVEIAPQRPVRSFGGFINLGLPLSRWFNANPKGHNAGWTLYLHAGKDQVVDRDLNNPVGSNGALNQANILAPLPLSMGKVFAATLYYKVNPWCTFAFEQSIYATRLLDHANGYLIAGQPSNEWQDHRTEFGPVFTF